MFTDGDTGQSPTVKEITRQHHQRNAQQTIGRDDAGLVDQGDRGLARDRTGHHDGDGKQRAGKGDTKRGVVIFG